MTTELFYAHILNMNRGSLHARHFRCTCIHLSVCRYRLTKNVFAGPNVSKAFEKQAPDLILQQSMCHTLWPFLYVSGWNTASYTTHFFPAKPKTNGKAYRDNYTFFQCFKMQYLHNVQRKSCSILWGQWILSDTYLTGQQSFKGTFFQQIQTKKYYKRCNFWGLVSMAFGLVYHGYSLSQVQVCKLVFLTPCLEEIATDS